MLFFLFIQVGIGRGEESRDMVTLRKKEHAQRLDV